MTTPYRKGTEAQRNIGLHKHKIIDIFLIIGNRSFPHYPQVSPQEKTGKPPANTGFAGGENVFSPFFTELVKNFFGLQNTEKSKKSAWAFVHDNKTKCLKK